MGADLSSFYFVSIVSPKSASVWAWVWVAEDGKVMGMEMGGEFGGEKKHKTNIQNMGVRMNHIA